MTGLVLAHPGIEAVESAMENRRRALRGFGQYWREWGCLSRRRNAIVRALDQANDPRGIGRVHPRSWFVVGAGGAVYLSSQSRCTREYRRLVTQARRWAGEEPGRAFTVVLYAPGGQLVATACVQTRRAA